MDGALEKVKDSDGYLETVSFFDFQVCDTTYDYFLHYIERSIAAGQRKIILAFNPKKVALAHESEITGKALKSADILIPDGYGIILASKLLGNRIQNRITGTDLMSLLCHTLAKESDERQYGIYIYGATPESLRDAVDKLRKENVHIVGGMDGYDHEDDEVVRAINRSGATILFVALGSPKQEIFIYNNADKLHNVRLIMGVGGSVDVISGHAKRAPVIIRKIGLEWLFRMICKPTRIRENKTIITYAKIVLDERRRIRKTG